jgi:hypothetical protein
MQATSDYRDRAHAHERIFRTILRDLKANRAKRSGGIYLPDELDPEEPIASIYERFSAGDRYDRFTIHDFLVNEVRAIITFSDAALLSGGGATLVYTIHGDTVRYVGPEIVWMS